MRKIGETWRWRMGIVSILATVLSADIYAQNIITGVVSDGSTNETLPGVNVFIVGATAGVITDFSGKYQINVPSSNSRLVFSYMGYLTDTMDTKGQTRIDVSLTPDLKSLDEVVVIGYGSSRKSDISGSISTLKSRVIQDIPSSNVATTLTGRVPGLQITASDGNPDAEIIMKIRGGGSLTQDNSPLIVVDGFPVGSLNDIAPTDIESFVVLKDASSAAIYGARGAYGVILITTKGAKPGKTKVNYSGYVQQRRFPLERSLDVLDPYEYVLMRYEYSQIGGRTTPEDFENLFGHYDDLHLYKYQKGTDWQEKMYGNPQWSHYHNLSISGGTEKTRVYLSYSYKNDDGLLVGSGIRRNNINLKLNHELTDRIRLELNTRYKDEKNSGAGLNAGSDLRIRDIIYARPVDGMINNTATLNPDDAGDEYEVFAASLIPPDEKLKDDYKSLEERGFDLNGAINWHVITNLTFRSEFGGRFNFEEENRSWGSTSGTSAKQGYKLPMGRITNSDQKGYRVANTLTYDLFVPIGNISIMAGQEILNSEAKVHEILALKFPEEIEAERIFANFALGEEIKTNSTQVYTPDRLSSFFGRVNAILLDRYIFNFTFRADGSTKFAPGKQWGYFPAGSFAWRISSEPFMKNVLFVNDLKLRAGYGTAGNNNIQNDIYRSVYKLGTDNYPGFGNTDQPFYESSSQYLANPDLKWETKITSTIALEYSLFKSRLIGTIEYFNNKSKDLLLEIDLPRNSGYTSMIKNVGTTSVKGFELSMNYTIINRGDFMLSASFNITSEKFKIEKLDDRSDNNNESPNDRDEIPFSSRWDGDLKAQDDYRIAVGSEVGLMYGWVTDGFYSVDDFEYYDETTGEYVLKEGVPYSELTANRPGSLKFVDLDTNGVLDLNDRTIIGKANPKYYGGFGLNSEYKGFDLSIFFTWKYGFDVYNTTQLQFTKTGRDPWGNMLDQVNSQNRFTYINDAGEYVTGLEELAAINQGKTVASPFSGAESSIFTHSDAIEDGTYLRLSTITLGYTIPAKLTAKLKIDLFRIYFTAQNVWLWTNYRGFDPEVSTRVNERDEFTPIGLTTPNLDFSSYPANRSFTMGVNITF